MDNEEHFYNNPKKAKNVFIVFLCLSILFFIGCAVLGCLYYRQYHLTKNANNQINQQNAQISSLNSKISTLSNSTSQNYANLLDQSKALNNQISDYQEKTALVGKYNTFFIYLNSVINAHGGFSGWTDSEYQVANQDAQATNDSTLVSATNSAWHQTTIDPIIRMLGVWNALASGIGNAIK